MEIDLSKFSLDELRKLKRNVEHHISTFEERKKREALAILEEKARELGMKLEEVADLIGQKRRKVKPKYRDPNNPSRTWTGRGRRPRWVDEALAQGKTLDDLMI